MGRAGLTGMLVLGARRGRRQLPYNRAELRGLALLASRAALSLEHLFYQRELITSERMAALGSMAGMLAHDFRGPMTVIRGYAETIADGGLAETDVQQRARMIMQMVDRLERMTGETLDYARGGGKLAARAVDAGRFVSELLRGLELEEPGLALVSDVQLPEGLVLQLDTDKLKRAAGNLAHNAAEAMKGAGRLHVKVRLEAALQPGSVSLLVLCFRDEGPGVPAGIRERVFEPFVTSGKKHGTGLGLAVARRFVEDHGGRLVLLPDGPGACFRMELPVVAAS
jgi:signal transduction histidine kinase